MVAEAAAGSLPPGCFRPLDRFPLVGHVGVALDDGTQVTSFIVRPGLNVGF